MKYFIRTDYLTGEMMQYPSHEAFCFGIYFHCVGEPKSVSISFEDGKEVAIIDFLEYLDE